MTKQLAKKLEQLPSSPGVYFYKDRRGEVIYIGKAASLRARVRQYWQKGRPFDPKTDALVAEIADVDWTQLETEVDALFLEAELVRRYLPRYNILLRDDKSQLFVRVDYKSDYPTVSLVRRPLDDGVRYFGPYMNGLAIKRALRYLRRAFPYATTRPVGQKRAGLYYHLGLDPGLEDGHTSLTDYRAGLRKLMQYLGGERVALTRTIERDMKKAAKAKDFEAATTLRNQLFALQELSRQSLFGDSERLDISRDQALVELANLLGLGKPPRRIEGFDISHMQGSDTTASLVVFTNGLPDKAAYRKFKMRQPGNDDFGHIAETISRRLGHAPRTSQARALRSSWGLPDLILIDGGKGQLRAALDARDAAGFGKLPMIGLAKRQEELIIHRRRSLPELNSLRLQKQAQNAGAYIRETSDFLSIQLPAISHLVKLLQRIRDESHRFALSYHSRLKSGRQSSSLLDEIPGVGEITRKKLIRRFGSARAVLTASSEELVAAVGPRRGLLLAGYLAQLKERSLKKLVQ